MRLIFIGWLLISPMPSPSPENTSHSSLITCLTTSFCLDVNPVRSILANIFCWCSDVAFSIASVFSFLMIVYWCWCSGWFSFSPLCLIGLHSFSSFVWIEDTIMLFELNFTGSGIIELMYSVLPTMVFFFSTMSRLELLLTGIRKSFSTWFQHDDTARVLQPF